MTIKYWSLNSLRRSPEKVNFHNGISTAGATRLLDMSLENIN